jgi:alkylated DNA repair dioxygenase AlkB
MIPILYIPKFVEDPDKVMEVLWDELAWERREYTPRYEYYCNDVNVPYTYGRGIGERTYFPKPYHPLIKDIRSKLEDHTGAVYQVCFLNAYGDQKDQLGWHADDSPEMDDNKPIGIVSLGVEREIWFCPKEDKKQIEKVLLQNGSLCLMSPGMQDTHLHRIPKASFQCGRRISLTFRGLVHEKVNRTTI